VYASVGSIAKATASGLMSLPLGVDAGDEPSAEVRTLVRELHAGKTQGR
jgi:hypothetical protein